MIYHRDIEKFLRKTANQYNIKIAFKNRKNLLSSIKTDRDKVNPTGGVYSIPVVDLENNKEYEYIGKTFRNIQTRIKEHQYNIKTKVPNTELAKTVLEKNYMPKWSNTKILITPKSKSALLIGESYEILRKQNLNINILNEKTSKDIPIIWSNWH